MYCICVYVFLVINSSFHIPACQKDAQEHHKAQASGHPQTVPNLLSRINPVVRRGLPKADSSEDGRHNQLNEINDESQKISTTSFT